MRGYQGQTEAIHEAAPAGAGYDPRRVKTKAGVDEEQKRKNRTKARVRAKVEWPFRILKRVFGFTKVRYRGLKKNHEWLCAAFASDQYLSEPQAAGEDQFADGPSRGVVCLPEAAEGLRAATSNSSTPAQTKLVRQ